MNAFWPGPLTIVFEASGKVSPLLTAGTGKIGLRVPGHPGAREIAHMLGKPITATSANLSHAPECVSTAEVAEHLGDKIDAIIDLGNSYGTVGSTIIDATCTPPKILRDGMIAKEAIAKYVNI